MLFDEFSRFRSYAANQPTPETAARLARENAAQRAEMQAWLAPLRPLIREAKEGLSNADRGALNTLIARMRTAGKSSDETAAAIGEFAAGNRNPFPDAPRVDEFTAPPTPPETTFRRVQEGFHHGGAKGATRDRWAYELVDDSGNILGRIRPTYGTGYGNWKVQSPPLIDSVSQGGFNSLSDAKLWAQAVLPARAAMPAGKQALGEYMARRHETEKYFEGQPTLGNERHFALPQQPPPKPPQNAFQPRALPKRQREAQAREEKHMLGYYPARPKQYGMF